MSTSRDVKNLRTNHADFRYHPLFYHCVPFRLDRGYFFIQLTGEVNCISHDYLTIMFLSSHVLNPMPSAVTILDGLWFVQVCCPFFLGGEDSGFLSFIIGFSTLGG